MDTTAQINWCPWNAKELMNVVVKFFHQTMATKCGESKGTRGRKPLHDFTNYTDTWEKCDKSVRNDSQLFTYSSDDNKPKQDLHIFSLNYLEGLGDSLPAFVNALNGWWPIEKIWVHVGTQIYLFAKAAVWQRQQPSACLFKSGLTACMFSSDSRRKSSHSAWLQTLSEERIALKTNLYYIFVI